ncbi:lipocalin family protein [Flavobacterium sp.]|uniref:lipocalin family protein n=2 Tax=Flavobacterium sp. TaxID=239 RepID=UPI0040343066
MMMKKFVLLFVFIAAVSCGKVSEDNLKHLNGYWEIQEVVMPDGTHKDYKVNATIDYFELKGKEGFRKKVMPQFDGKYLANDVSEKIAVAEKDGKTFISYTTQYAKWEEEILSLDEDKLVVKNNHDMEYHYKRAQPFTVK